MDGALRDFADNNPGMKQFVERYELASADKETRTAYRKWEYEQALHIMELQMQWAEGKEEGKAEGKEEGKAEGREEGKAEDKIEVAKNALAMGLSVEQIEKLTGMSREEIEQLRNAD
jgi:predicted transposase/invertase (TIGR01784 family)